jgi:hypothetical protein
VTYNTSHLKLFNGKKPEKNLLNNPLKMKALFNPSQIIPVSTLGISVCQFHQLVTGDEAHAVGNLFNTTDFLALAFLDNPNKFTGIA